MVADPFTTTILRLRDLGFFKFLLPFILTSAVFYGLLRKSQLFGPSEKNVAVNAVVSLVAAFWVLAVPIINGVDTEAQFARFFAQSTTAILVGIVGIMIAGILFPEGLPKVLESKWAKGGSWSVVVAGGLIIGVIIFLSSGLATIFFPADVFATVSEDVLITIGVVFVLLITVFALVYLGGAGGGGK